ncbi:MAG: PQQ-binding-like beta-propeller repeat protein [Phycisphaerae bacterium]|jgi:outer membrane protein assembly factor BamB
MTVIRGALLMVLSVAGGAMAGEHWPQWRGPTLNGQTDSTDLPLSWSEEKNVKWKVRLPSWSGATPIIWGDRIFVMSPSAAGEGPNAVTVKGMAGPRPREGQDLLLLCYAKKDGAPLWKRKLAGGNVHYGKQNMASCSPVTDGKMVWAMTGTGLLTALDMDGNVLWDHDLQKKHGRFGHNWGYASSPLLLDDKLIVEVLHGFSTDDPSYLLAFEPATGKVIWKVERPTDALNEAPDGYTTPIPIRRDGRTEILISGGDYITGHDPATGKELWRCGGMNPTRDRWYRTVCSPLAVDDLVFGSEKKGPLVACKAGVGAPDKAADPVWTTDLACDVPTPVSDGRHLYVLHDNGFLSCLDPKTGKPFYARQRLPRGTYSASPLLAGDRLYCLSESGRTTVVAAGPEFKVLSENQLDDGYTLSSIAVSGRELFIRTSTSLYCISE